MVPRVAGRVGDHFCHTGSPRRGGVTVVRIKKAINSVRDRPFLRTVHRFRLGIKRSGTVLVRMALVPCLGTSRRLGAGPARTDMGRLRKVKVRPSMLIYEDRRRLARSVGRGVTLFYGMPMSRMLRGLSIRCLCRTPLTVRERGLTSMILSDLHLRGEGPSLDS